MPHLHDLHHSGPTHTASDHKPSSAIAPYTVPSSMTTTLTADPPPVVPSPDDPPKPTKEAIAAAARFIRDLYYNPTLRDAYWDAINNPLVRVDKKSKKPQDPYRIIKGAINDLLTSNGYSCTYNDLVEGSAFKIFTDQSLLAWSSIYQLLPKDASKAVGTDPVGQGYKCMVIGSRTPDATVLWDDVPVKGLVNTFLKDGFLSWASGNNKFNVKIHFAQGDVAPGSDPTMGNRIMIAKIWADGAEPDDWTHTGHDFFTDMSHARGTYDTSVTVGDPQDGQIQDGPPVALTVENQTTSNALATITVQLTTDTSSVPLAVALKADRNTVTWDSKANAKVDWDDYPDYGDWKQGYLNSSWTWVPPQTVVLFPGGPPIVKPGYLRATIQGSVYMDSRAESVGVTGSIRIDDSIVGDNDDSAAYWTGLAGSIGIFILVGVGILKTLKRLIQGEDKKDNADPDGGSGGSGGSGSDDPTNPDTDLDMELFANEKEEIELRSEGTIVDREVGRLAVDVNDPRTYNQAQDPEGKPRVVNGEKLYENPMDITGKTTIASYENGDGKIAFQLLDNEGESVLKSGTLKLDKVQPFQDDEGALIDNLHQVQKTLVAEAKSASGELVAEVRTPSGDPLGEEGDVDFQVVD